MSFRDHFSAQAADYARVRPTYPAALFAWLAQRAPARERAWDCATGNGQAARGLAARFAEVVASDASLDQLARAGGPPNVLFVAGRAERAPLADRSVDLVAVATALHWFDLEPFYDEVRRVLRPGGLLAAWSYDFLRVDPKIDALIDRFAGVTVARDWPPERRYVDERYRTIPFPFGFEGDVPRYTMTLDGDLAWLRTYLGTWSAVQRHRRRTGRDPVEPLIRAVAPLWGDPAARRTIRWPLFMKVGLLG